MDQPELLALFWSLYFIASVLLVTRLRIVWNRHSRLRSDDYCLIFAYACLTVLGTLYTISIPTYINIQAWQAGEDVPAPSAETLHFVRDFNAAQGVMLITEEWLVKLSFLFFLRRVVKSLPNKWWMRLWWVNISIWGITLAESFSFNIISGKTIPRPDNIRFLKTLNFVQAVSNIVGDIAIIVYPLPLVSRLRKITMKQRIGLYSMFSLCAITITACIMRLVSLDRRIDQLRAWIWLTIECQVALAVGTLPGIIPSFKKTNSSISGPSNEVSPGGMPPHGAVDPIENRKSRRMTRNWMDISISLDRTRQGSVAVVQEQVQANRDIDLQGTDEKDLEKCVEADGFKTRTLSETGLEKENGHILEKELENKLLKQSSLHQ